MISRSEITYEGTYFDRSIQRLPLRPSVFILFCITILTLTVYGKVFTHSFINYDDRRIITDRIDKYDGMTWENIQDIFVNDFPREEPLPLRDFSYLINAEIFGPLNPQGYLWGNIILHIGVSFLVYFLGLNLFPGNYCLAMLAAIFFVLHPVHVESIAWISSRKDPLYTLFFLAAFLSYARYLSQGKGGYLVLGLLLFAASLLSKASAIAFLPAIICYRFLIIRHKPWRSRELFFFGTTLALTVFYIKWYTGILKAYGIVFPNSMINRDWALWALGASEYITFYLGKFFSPKELSPFYDFPAPGLVFYNIPYLIASLAVVLSIMAIFWLRRFHEDQRPTFLICFFGCALLPYLDFARVGIYVADRYLYLASVALSILVAGVLVGIYQRAQSCKTRGGVIVVVIILCILCGLQTVKAVPNWDNTTIFWQNANRVAPNRADTYSGLMGQYLNFYKENPEDPYAQLAVAEAERIGLRAMEKLCPSRRNCPKELFYVTTLLAGIYADKNQKDLADFYFDLTFAINKKYIKGRYIYAIILLRQGRYPEAAGQLALIKKQAHPYLDRDILHDVTTRLIPLADQHLDPSDTGKNRP